MRPMRPGIRTTPLSLVLAGLLALCMTAVLIGSDAASAATSTVQVGQRSDGSSGNAYTPASVTIPLGDTVSFIRFAGSHDVFSAVVPAGASAFTSPSPMAAGVAFNVTPTVVGTYTYYCSIHSDPSEATLGSIDANISGGRMVGKIVVTAPVADTTAPTVSGVSGAPNPTAGSGAVTLTATVNDTAPVGATPRVASAEWSKGAAAAAAGSGTAMNAADGSFSGASEGVTANVPIIEAPGTSVTLWVRGRDAAGNWSTPVSTTISVTAPPAGAIQATITVTGGNLTNQAQPILFPGVSLNGSDQTVAGSTAAWRASDARGTGAGWNVTVTSTNFTSSGGSIPVANFKVQLLSVTTVAGNTPPATSPGSFTSLSTASPLKLLSAAAGTGMGSYEYTPEFQLTVPGNAGVGAYTANVTVSVNSGP